MRGVDDVIISAQSELSTTYATTNVQQLASVIPPPGHQICRCADCSVVVCID